MSKTVGPTADEQLKSWQERWTRANAELGDTLNELAESRAKVDALRQEVAALKSQNYKLSQLVPSGQQVTA